MKRIIAWLKSVRTIILAATAVLVGAAALINSGIDVYQSYRHIPKGVKEKNNADLFQKHFKESPVFTKPLSIKSGGTTRQVNIDIYNNGDIFVLFGSNGQWFPFQPDVAFLQDEFVTTAYAETAESSAGSGNYVQTNGMDGPYVTQDRVYDNGVREVIKIDKNTGNIISRETTTGQPSQTEGQSKVTQSKPTVIDVDAIKAQ